MRAGKPFGLHDVFTAGSHSLPVNTWATSAAKPTSARPKKQPPIRRSPAPRPALAGSALVVAGAGLGATTALTITAETAGQLTATGGLATFAGNLTGMAGTYLALLMVRLVSRIPFIEQVLGQDGLLRWHRRLTPWPISLLIGHAVLLTAGYARAARSGPGRQHRRHLRRHLHQRGLYSVPAGGRGQAAQQITGR
jgi:hypothetical protein